VALIDTGATHNLIHRHALRDTAFAPTQNTHLNTAIAGAHTNIRGTQKLRCTFGKVHSTSEFLVIDDLVETAILGYPFLAQHEACLDVPRGCLYIGAEERTTIFLSTASTKRPQSLREGLASVTRKEAPAVEDVQHGFPKQLEPDLHQLLSEFRDVFNHDPAPTTTTTTKHTIHLRDHTPFRVRPYRYSDKKKLLIEEQVEQMLADGIIEPATSEYASPVVIVRKKDGRPRFCVDYRRLNEITKDEAAPLPIIHETLRDLGQAKVFTTLDLKSGYWQVPLAEESKQYTAFSTPDGGLYQFRVMPFGLKGAPSTFQRLMCQEVLPGYLRKFAMVYLDDIIVYSQSYREHLRHLRLVFERLQTHGLCCSPQKCHLGEKKITYLGHVVTDRGNYPQELHLQQIQNAAMPKDRRALRGFLGLCNWLRDYVPNFANLAYPLTDLLSHKKPYRWGVLEQQAFDNVKKALSSRLLLHRPDPNKPFVLQTDASGVGMAAVLYQEEGNERRVISYSSARFNPTERRYHSNEQECLAVVWAIRRYRPYLEDNPFKLRTDNKALVWLQQMKDERAKLTRWAIELQGYRFTIEHCPGRENQLADILSRDPEERLPQDEDLHDTDRLLPPARHDQAPTACCVQIQTLADEVRQAQRDDDEFTDRMVALLQGEGAPQEPWHRTFRRLYTTRDGLLFGPGEKLYVPTNVRLRVLYENHDKTLAGHPGAEETERTVREHYHWPQLSVEVRDYVRHCLLCAQVKRGAPQPAAPLRPRQPQRPFEVIACDVMGPYPETPAGFKYIFVVTDLFSRWVEAFPTAATPTTEAIRIMEEEVFPRQGYPRAIVTDNGAQFTSRSWKRACQHWQVQTWTTAPYTPRENPTERRNQELKKALRVRLAGRELNTWDREIPTALFNVRRRRNAATGMSPSRLLYGRDLAYPGAWNAPGTEAPRAPEAEREEIARRNQQRYVERRQQGHDAIVITFQPGDRVMLKVPEQTRNQPFGFKWTGPHHVVHRIGESHIYLVQTENGRSKHHVDRLKPAYP
jgi:transposase InsO family protein